jgi:hypothetical protein
MITKLSIKNFKSIKELDIDCARVNLFIGEPNTGKSNILEALGLLSWFGFLNDNIGEYVRLQYMYHLFYDYGIEEDIRIAVDSENDEKVEIKFDGDYFTAYSDGKYAVTLDKFGNNIKPPDKPAKSQIKIYKFINQYKYLGNELSFLMPPHGSNMLLLISGHKKLRETVSPFFRELGFKIMIREYDNTWESTKEINESIFGYPSILVSDTLQRMIFYNVAIDSNENSVLVFEEPEVHAFPSYIKQLGEKIAFDESNQYFIVTHNPYLFLSIVEKAPKDDVNVFITYMEDYQTKVKQANDKEISKLMRYDPFFNLTHMVGKETQ